MTKLELLREIKSDLMGLALVFTEQGEGHADIVDQHRSEGADPKEIAYGELLALQCATTALVLCQKAEKYELLYDMEVAQN